VHPVDIRKVDGVIALRLAQKHFTKLTTKLVQSQSTLLRNAKKDSLATDGQIVTKGKDGAGNIINTHLHRQLYQENSRGSPCECHTSNCASPPSKTLASSSEVEHGPHGTPGKPPDVPPLYKTPQWVSNALELVDPILSHLRMQVSTPNRLQ